jgi:hypothetical protein
MKREASKSGPPTIIFGKYLMAMLMMAAAWGCKGGGVIDPSAGLDEDQKAIQELVYGLADSTRDLDQFRGVFAKDKAPPSSARPKYKDYVFFVDDEITVSGNTASFTAGMETQHGEDEPVVTKLTWTAVKEADGWKLQDAPLP